MISAEQKNAVRILITGMTQEERNTRLAQLRRNSGRSATDAALLQYAQSVAAEAERRERRMAELECKVSALERSQGAPAPSSISPDLLRGALALTAIGAGVWGAYHLIALIVTAGLLPWIGGVVLLAFLFGSLSDRKQPPPPSAGRRDQTIHVNVNINQQQ